MSCIRAGPCSHTYTFARETLAEVLRAWDHPDGLVARRLRDAPVEGVERPVLRRAGSQGGIAPEHREMGKRGCGKGGIAGIEGIGG